MGKGGGGRDEKKGQWTTRTGTLISRCMLWHACKKNHLTLTRSCSYSLFPFCLLRSINGILHSIHDTKAFTAMASAQLVRAIQSVQSQELAKKEASIGEYLWIIIANM